MTKLPKKLAEDWDHDEISIREARHHDPFAWLGQHRIATVEGAVQRVFLPGASRVELQTPQGWMAMTMQHPDGIFIHTGESLPTPYRYRWQDSLCTHEAYDPYVFSPPNHELLHPVCVDVTT